MQVLRLVLRRGESLEPLDRTLAVGDHLGHAGPDRLDGEIAPIGKIEIGQGAVNCSWMIHVVRLCRLNLSAGAFSLHAD